MDDAGGTIFVPTPAPCQGGEDERAGHEEEKGRRSHGLHPKGLGVSARPEPGHLALPPIRRLSRGGQDWHGVDGGIRTRDLLGHNQVP